MHRLAYILKRGALAALTGLVLTLPGSAAALDNTIYDNQTTEWRTRCLKQMQDLNKDALKIVGTNAVATVEVPDTCGTLVSLTTYKAHKDFFPLNTQVAYAWKTVALTPGTSTITVALPPTDCFYQTDLYLGGPVLDNNEDFGYYLNHSLSYASGGEKDCIAQTTTEGGRGSGATEVATTPVATPQVKTVPTGGVNAGGGAMKLSATAIAGLIASLASLGYGLRRWHSKSL